MHSLDSVISRESSYLLHQQQTDVTSYPESNQPSFRGIGSKALDFSGKVMKNIEDGGFLILFLLQDFIGMTCPRTIAGFLRDSEVTGHYNKQEGLEVFGREGLTGPCMMAVAPLSLYFAAKVGRTTSVNSELIKRYGDSLREMLSDNNFDRLILKDSKAFKDEFYKFNIRKILADTLGKENVSEKSVEYILGELHNIENIPEGVKLAKFRGKAKYRQQCFENITKHINDIKYSTSTDLNMLEQIKFGSEKLNSKKVFSAKSAFDAMIKYSDDAITANKHLEKLTDSMAESIKHKALGKRVLTTVAMLGATLGILSVLPKIYARSNVAPGARQNITKQEQQNNENANVSFKGSKKSIIEKIGKIVDKNKNDFVSSELEYNGYNFTHTLMAGLSLLGLLLPRGLRAYSRAQTDENGKKDLTELWEIITRDVSSSLAVIFAVPMLTRACVSSYENKSGFVLMNKDRTPKSWWKKTLDIINPYSKSKVLSNVELSALYDNINSKSKMMNFCKYIDANGGDLQKILSKSENIKELFNSETFELETIKDISKSDKNKKIISFVENIEDNVKKLKNKKSISTDSLIEKVMNGVEKGRKSKISSFARGMNSIPALLTTLAISPYLLGWFIPRLTYKNTRRIHAKQDMEAELNKQQKLKTSA